jgi:hypothetical protein
MILLSKQVKVFYEFNKFKAVDNFENASRKLQDIGLGEFKMEKKLGSSKSSNCFIKVDTSGYEKPAELIFMNKLMPFDVSITAYRAAFNNNKRNNSNSTMSESKKINA